MKKIPKTPIEFDYDLWTTEDGKCMVRVKLTGEVCEVGKETMRVLRNEEKRLRRSLSGTNAASNGECDAVALSLDYVGSSDDDYIKVAWMNDPHDFTEDIATQMLEDDLIKMLTPRERDVYIFCIRNGGAQHEYAEETGLSISRVCKIVTAIRNKAKKFSEGCQVFYEKCPL